MALVISVLRTEDFDIPHIHSAGLSCGIAERSGVEILPNSFRRVLWVKGKLEVLKKRCWGAVRSVVSFWPCRGGDELVKGNGNSRGKRPSSANSHVLGHACPIILTINSFPTT